MPNLRELKRKSIIDKIVLTLKELNKANLKYDEDKFLSEIQKESGATKKTALDYLKTAKKLCLML